MGKGTKGGRENPQISGADDDDALIFFSEIFRKYCAVFPTNTRIKLQLLPPISLPKTREREKECLEIPGVAFQSFLPLSPPEKKRSHLGKASVVSNSLFFVRLPVPRFRLIGIQEGEGGAWKQTLATAVATPFFVF